MESLDLSLREIVDDVEEEGVAGIQEIMMVALWEKDEEIRQQAREKLGVLCPGILRGAYVENNQMVFHVVVGDLSIRFFAGQVPGDYQNHKPYHFIAVNHDNRSSQ